MKSVSILILLVALAASKDNLQDLEVACVFENKGYLFDYTTLGNT